MFRRGQNVIEMNCCLLQLLPRECIVTRGWTIQLPSVVVLTSGQQVTLYTASGYGWTTRARTPGDAHWPSRPMYNAAADRWWHETENEVKGMHWDKARSWFLIEFTTLPLPPPPTVSIPSVQLTPHVSKLKMAALSRWPRDLFDGRVIEQTRPTGR